MFICYRAAILPSPTFHMHFLSSPAGRSGVQATLWPKAHTKQNMGVSSKEQAEGADSLVFLSYVSVGCKKLTPDQCL